MRCAEMVWTPAAGWHGHEPLNDAAGLVLYSGARRAITDGARYRELLAVHSAAPVPGCSPGGEIGGGATEANGVAALTPAFRATWRCSAAEPHCAPPRSCGPGTAAGRALAGPGLAGGFVLAVGPQVNGGALAGGLAAALGPAVRVSGGADRLVAGATAAARAAGDRVPAADHAALRRNGIGRLALGQGAREAIEAMAGRLPPGTHRIGFSCDGEGAPRPDSGTAGLQTETMTVTLLSEAA
ncbi:hypothetical protein E2C06_15295 [Dankookia rubra]|uniref:FIST domain-containing protein n=1 Tax=Dankookia rubra TaxID=1442381 RepID=A0A4R5QG48_9PROT|nr:FIST N-terminal domain-containing protein [Dankookia rubra]TDH61688.1 hypothetical protein E2C06_15295 [Dankookia rubra]